MSSVEDRFQASIYQTPEYKQMHERLPDFPLVVDIEPTNGCNLDCVFCQRQIMQRPVKTLRDEWFHLIIDEMATHQPTSVRFSGWGEPTMHPRIVDFVKYAHDKGVLTHLTTNAVLMTPDLARRLLEAGLDKIKFSLQGLSATEYDRMRIPRVDDDERFGYANITSHIRQFIAVRDEMGAPCHVQISVSMLKREQEDDAARQAFHDLWAPVVDSIWGLGRIGVYGGQPLLTSFQRVKDTGRIALEDIEGGRPDRGHDINAGCACWEPFNKLSVGADGAIKACCDDADNNLVMGQLPDDTLHGVWHGERIAALREVLTCGDRDRIPPFCRMCDNYF